MRLMRYLLVAFLFLLFVTPKTFASDNFTTDYAVTYTVQEDATTHAHFAITLTNLSSQYYASSYKIEVGFPNVNNVAAHDSQGTIHPLLTDSVNGHEVGLKFNDSVVGKGNKLTFAIDFDTPDIAAKHGSIWEINIPGIANQGDFSTFNVSVKTPEDFGKPTFIKPPQPTSTMVFTKDMLGKSGISIAYGDKQTYQFHLTYHLRNANLFPVQTEIALPPTTNYQDVFMKNLNPKPQNVTIDTDGNWLATYVLAPSQRIDVLAEGLADVHIYPKKELLPKEKRALYTKPLAYWGENSGEIQRLGRELKTPKAIFDYVVKKLSYDYTRVTDNKPRLGAAKVLTSPTSAVCLEFTDLFIAIARAAGIPAREINGFAYTQNTKERPLSLLEDILHAWPEYYDADQQTWVMVDPTWSNTTGGVDYFDTLDFDHFAFVVKGESSTYPVPAGGYKYPGDEKKKDVQVTLSDLTGSVSQQVSLNTRMNKSYLAGLPIKGQIIIANVGQRITDVQELAIASGVLLPNNQSLLVKQIPPFGSVTLPFSFDKTSLLTNKSARFTMSLGGTSMERTITIKPFLLMYPIEIGGVLIAILTITLFIIARRSGGVSIPGSIGKRFIRRESEKS